MIECRVAHSMEEYSQVVSDKVFKDLFLYPFSHSQTFLMPTAHRDQGYCPRNNCFAEADHSTWLKGFGLSLLLLHGTGQCRTETTLTPGCSIAGCNSSKKLEVMSTTF